MNFREIEIICELVNYKSFSEASYSLAYSPSVITKHVNNVEKELGVKLFIRSNKSSELQLTSEGELLINIMNHINGNYHLMLEMVNEMKTADDNKLRIGSTPRFGNQQEEEIIVSYLFENPGVEIYPVKMFQKDLMKLLQSGKLDCMFATIHGDLDVEKCFEDSFNGKIDNSELDVFCVSDDMEIYFGISEKYLRDRKIAKFKDFKDFTFAFPFTISSDEQSQRAISSFKNMAQKNDFELKTMFAGQSDSTLFKLATMMKIAISTTNVPVAKYDGIKFVKVSDWDSYTKLYFICLKNNRKRSLYDLKQTVKRYIKLKESDTGERI